MHVTPPMTKPIHDDSTDNAHIHHVKGIFTFDPKKEKVFIENIGRDGNTEKLSYCLNHTENNREQIENSIEILNNILLNAAKKSLMYKRVTKYVDNTSPKKGQRYEWFTKECKAISTCF